MFLTSMSVVRSCEMVFHEQIYTSFTFTIRYISSIWINDLVAKCKFYYSRSKQILKNYVHALSYQNYHTQKIS